MQATRQRSISSASAKSKASMHASEYRPASGDHTTALQPCTSNNRFFIFSQGSSILCVRQDTLELERRFEAHAADISLISADTYSDNEIPQVISLDVNKEAVVWDPTSGDEIARFTAYEEIKVATFMKNGTIALGDAMGNIILFDPIRSEAVSCRTFQLPICAIAPSADNNFFGIGYADGTMIIATLMPTFMIHHTLSQATSFGVTHMAWHGSSSRQKSDMLATQTDDGDLKVWSIAKPIDGGEAARIVRVLKKPENYGRSRNWMSWSRNGRIVQYCDSETAIWDVRTKRVVWEPVPTSDNIVGLSVFGGKGQLFTLGKDHTVQQYSLYPPELVANVQHLPIAPPPSPPISEGSERKRTSDNDADMNKQVSYPPQGIDERPSSKGSKHSSKESGSRPGSKQDQQQPQPQRHGNNRSVDLPRSMTPLGQIAQELEAIENMERDHMSAISMSRTTSLASNASAHSRKNSAASVSSVKSYNSMTGSETSSLSSVPRRFHPLSKEVGTLSPIPMSPDTPKAPNQGTLATPRFAQAPPAELSPPVESAEASDFYEQQGYFVPNPAQMDIFANLRAKISNVMFQTPLAGVDRPKYEDEMRKEMFRVVFGWQGDVLGLIREELEAIPPRSLQAIILKIWLGELDQNALAVLMGSDMLVSSDWMFVALSAMSGTKGWQQCMRVFVMRLIQRGDLHTAVTCLIALGDKKDALDLYVSNKRYMEAVILCGLISGDWRKLSSLVRKWGEHAAENGEGGLAMRCFACTESSDSTPPLPSATFSTKSGTFPQSPKSPKLKLGIMRPNSPQSSVMHSLTGGAARLFGFGDKNKEKELQKEKEKEKEREKEKENEANIMEMPWNKPAEPGLIESPKSPGLPGMPMDNEFRDMSISGPMTTTPIEMRVGTPVLPRITSPGMPRSATPGSINSVGSFRMGSPAPSMTQQRQSPVVPPQRTVSPRPAGVTPIVRTVSPRPQFSSQFEEPAGSAANNALPLQRVASPPITQVASMAPPVAPIKIASPPPPRSMTPRSAEQSKAGNAGRKPQGLQIQLATFSDVLAGEHSPELTRSTKSFSHRPTKSVGDSIKRDAAPSRSGRERFREERNEPTTTDDEEIQQQQQQRRDRNRPSKKTVRTPEESEDYDSEQDEEIERKLRERRRSLERLEREMGDLKMQRAQNVSRNMNRAPSRNANLRRKDTYSTNDDESAEEVPRRRRANTVSDVSDVEQDYRPARVPRVASRNANRTPKPRYRQQDDEDFAPPRRIASPSMRAPSRNGRTPKPKRGDISEEEEEEMVPRRVLSPVHRTGSRATSRTPRPRQAPLASDSEEMPPPPPRRTASRATARTPKPRYEPSASDSEEVPPPPRMASRNAFRRQYTEPDMVDQEWDDRERERNNRSRNALRRSKSESRARHYANDYDDFNPRLPRSPNNSGLPSNPSISRSNTPALPRSKTPAVPPLPEMRSTTPAVGPGSHRRNVSVGEIARPLSPPQGKLPAVPRSQTPKVPQDASVPDYDRHDYDLPALAAASQGQMAHQQKSAAMNDDLKSTLPQHLKSRFAALPPTPESPMGIPSDLPLHPAFAGNMRATSGQRRKPTMGPGPLSRSQTISPGPEDGGNNYVLSPGGKQALRMHSGPGRDDMITVGLSGVVMDDKGAPVETAPPPRAGRMTPMGQKI